MEDTREWMFGPHRARFEAPDLVLLQYHGNSSLKDAQLLVEILREVGTQHRYFAIIDISGSRNNASESRRYLAQHLQPEWFLGIIYVGANLLQKTLLKTMLVTLRFTQRWTLDFQFASTEAEARTLVAGMRAKGDSWAA